MAHSHTRLRTLRQGGSDTYRDLQHRLESLSADLARLSGDAATHGHHALDEVGHHAGELLDDAVKQGRVAAARFSRQMVSTGKAVQRDPVPVLVAIGTLVLVSSLLMRRR